MKRNGALVAGLVLAGLIGGPVAESSARDPVYRTPGYRGTSKAPRTRPGPAPSPIVLSQNGRDPNVLVDAAGTAHVVWIDPGEIGVSADVLRYCRIKRGAKGCDNPPATQALVPPQPDPRFNDDVAGPRVLAVGDDLALITHRYPNVIEHPDGQTSDRTTYLYLSDDGGSTFSPPVIVSDAEPSGEAIAFGSPDAPLIGLISDTRTGGTFFQGIPPGRYLRSQANLALPDPNRAYGGTLGLLDGRPLAAFSGLDAQTSIRAWTGQGDVNDPATWTDTDRVPGDEPDLASGPSGNFLLNRPRFGAPFEVRRLQGTRPGAPTAVSNTDDKAEGRLFQDPGGLLHASWVDRTARRLVVRRSRNGRRWTSAERETLREQLHSMRRLGLYVAVMLIPGTALTLPLLAWWLDRRHARRASPSAEFRESDAN